MNDPAPTGPPPAQRLRAGRALGNVTAASRQAKMDRTSFYEYTRRFQSTAWRPQGPAPIHHSHLATTHGGGRPNPRRGSQYPQRCVWISASSSCAASPCPALPSRISSTSTSWFPLRTAAPVEPRPWRRRWNSPPLGDGHREAIPVSKNGMSKAPAPGEQLCQDTFYIGHFKGTAMSIAGRGGHLQLRASHLGIGIKETSH